jgi:hypothetical protein
VDQKLSISDRCYGEEEKQEMSNRCLGIILGHVTGRNSAHVQEMTGYPPPWTMLDAQVYLGMNGIGLGIGLGSDDSCGELEIFNTAMFDLKSLPLGCIVILPSNNGDTISVKRSGYAIKTPLMHSLLYRDGKWLDPQPGEILKEVPKPDNIYQIWPMYQVAPKKEVMRD